MSAWIFYPFDGGGQNMDIHIMISRKLVRNKKTQLID